MLNELKTVLSHDKYFLLWLATSFLFSCIYILLPVNFIPGNTVDFFLRTTPIWQLAIILLLAMMMGLMVSMQFYIRNELNSRKGDVKVVAVGALTSFSSTFSGLFSSVTCINCIAGLFAFIGLGSSFAFFLIQYQWYIVGISFILAILSIHLSAKRMSEKNCEFC